MFKHIIAAAFALAQLALLPSAAHATTFYLKDVKFDDGATVNGRFSANQYGIVDYRNVVTSGGTLVAYQYNNNANMQYDPGDSGFTLYHPDYDGYLTIQTAERLDMLNGAAAILTGGASYECSSFSCPGGGIARHVVSGFITTVAPNAVPEPASWALMLAGIGVVGAGLRRRGRFATVLA
jgi:hypothetical protein